MITVKKESHVKFSKPYSDVSAVGSVTVTEAKNVYYEADGAGGFVIRRRPGLQSTLANSDDADEIWYVD